MNAILRDPRTAAELPPDAFIHGTTWTFAKTMPQAPHEYTVRDPKRAGPFVSFVRHIRTHGFSGMFAGRTYIYLTIAPWTYWTMGHAPEATTIINRKRAQL